MILQKNKAPELCSSYQPVRLLGVDMKILSKVLKCVMTHIVDEDQTGSIKGWMSCHNTRCLFNLIHHFNHS